MLPQNNDDKDKYILCVGMCVLDIIQVCSTYPEEDSDKRLYTIIIIYTQIIYYSKVFIRYI